MSGGLQIEAGIRSVLERRAAGLIEGLNAQSDGGERFACSFAKQGGLISIELHLGEGLYRATQMMVHHDHVHLRVPGAVQPLYEGSFYGDVRVGEALRELRRIADRTVPRRNPVAAVPGNAMVLAAQ